MAYVKAFIVAFFVSKLLRATAEKQPCKRGEKKLKKLSIKIT